MLTKGGGDFCPSLFFKSLRSLSKRMTLNLNKMLVNETDFQSQVAEKSENLA